MRHDELLVEIDRRLEIALYNGDPQSLHALRAVVELHKVLLVKDYQNDSYWYECQECTREISPSIPYPCPTIQAVEKELT